MNILYIHGLNGSLSPEKRAILETYGTVFSPTIDFENSPNSISDLIKAYQDQDINVVIGSSMGGFAGYYVSNAFQQPALLFNPALEKRPVRQNIPEITYPAHQFKHIILGTADDVVNPRDTLKFLTETIAFNPEYNIHLRHDLAHRIPINIFKEEVASFFANLC